MNEKEFLKIITPEGEDRLRIKISTEKGIVVDIVVQYETYIDGKWFDIVRYDCAHGFLHRDLIYPKKKKNKLWKSQTLAMHYSMRSRI